MKKKMKRLFAVSVSLTALAVLLWPTTFPLKFVDVAFAVDCIACTCSDEQTAPCPSGTKECPGGAIANLFGGIFGTPKKVRCCSGVTPSGCNSSSCTCPSTY